MNEQAPPSTPPALALVLFDDTCALCRNLAGFLLRRAKGAFAVMAWQAFVAAQGNAPASAATTLRVLVEGEMLEGQAAWDYLLKNYHDMEGLNWIAQKLGLRREATIMLDRAGHALRRVFCRRCPHHGI